MPTNLLTCVQGAVATKEIFRVSDCFNLPFAIITTLIFKIAHFFKMKFFKERSQLNSVNLVYLNVDLSRKRSFFCFKNIVERERNDSEKRWQKKTHLSGQNYC